ncbi:MAG: hypothetical protein WA950_02020 [Shinella sp.]|uniref:ORC-CDC6 family AAA ATPase n=1 Tax=Shinella sp. TaxID=1870904 RepID=UPI003C77BAA2
MVVVTQFNARNSSPSQIAATFVMPEYFEEVAAYQNTVLIGPRGIGKTTLLKTLTAQGLVTLHQRKDVAERLKKIDFNYTPIYIPAESIWKGTSHVINEEIGDESDRDLISSGLFCDHCLYHVVSSIDENRDLKRSLKDEVSYPWLADFNDSNERKIATACAEIWQLPGRPSSLLGLKLDLLKRVNQFRAAISSRDTLDELRKGGRLDFLVMLRAFLDITDKFAGLKRWTISFDEMEIAPKRVLADLYESLRSFDQRTAIKLSLFPYVDFIDQHSADHSGMASPNPAQDFHTVVLSSKFSNPDYSFARNIVRSECEVRNIAFGEFIAYLNSSNAILHGTRRFSDDGFVRQPKAIYQHVVHRAGDQSFKAYMESKGVHNEDDVEKVTGEASRAQTIRKIFPIAELRAYYLSKTKSSARGDSVRRSSVKGFGYYHGFDQVISLTEGNPRAIKYYLNELLQDMRSGIDSRVAQNKAISQNVDRFRALVASQSADTANANGTALSTLQLIDLLGYSLANSLYGNDFPAEPALSYKIKNLNVSMRRAMISAINSGAIIVEEQASGKNLLFDLEGCRLRISHRLAPFYKLPTITGQERILSEPPQKSAKFNDQPDLLNWGGVND